MKALVKKEPMKGIWMQDVPVPEMGVNDVLIKIKKTAICGTDLHIYKWDEWSQKTIKTPMTIGHEYVGIVEKIGAGVRNIKVGDRVTGEGHIACGHCRNCRRGLQHICENSIGVGVNRDGAFAEYLCIPESNVVKLDPRISDDIVSVAFSEQPSVVIQIKGNKAKDILEREGIEYQVIGKPIAKRAITLVKDSDHYELDINALRDIWFKGSYLLDCRQSGSTKARDRFKNYKKQDLRYDFGEFTGKAKDLNIDMHRRTPSGIKAAIIREKGVNGDREMAYALYLAGFDVKDVHTTDLISGREDLSDVNMIVFAGVCSCFRNIVRWMIMPRWKNWEAREFA